MHRIANALNGFLGLSISGKPGCVGQKLVVDNTTYTLDPPTVPAAWPCLTRTGDKISVDLDANSPNGWIVRSDPASTDQGVDLTADVASAVDQAAYRTLFAASVGNGTFMLPGGTTHLRFDKAQPPQQVTLRADPGVHPDQRGIPGISTLSSPARAPAHPRRGQRASTPSSPATSVAIQPAGLGLGQRCASFHQMHDAGDKSPAEQAHRQPGHPG